MSLVCGCANPACMVNGCMRANELRGQFANRATPTFPQPGQTFIPPPPLTEGDIRRIIREEKGQVESKQESDRQWQYKLDRANDEARGERTARFNLELDLQRVLRGEPTLNNFQIVNDVEARLSKAIELLNKAADLAGQSLLQDEIVAFLKEVAP